MTDREKALRMLEDIAYTNQDGDIENNHASADEILCTLLASLGYQDVVDAWCLVKKWYA